MPLLTKSELDEIRTRSEDHMSNVPNTHDRAQLDISRLLAHIDAKQEEYCRIVRQATEAAEELGCWYEREADLIAREAALSAVRRRLEGHDDA